MNTAKIFILLLLIFLSSSSFAINWVEVKGKNGQSGQVDLDSIKVFNNCYFYNIKVFNKYKNEQVVITMQSRANSPLSARIRYYKPSEYEDLGGDYNHITDNYTKKTEPVEFGSLVYACYSMVKSTIISKQIQISI